MGDLERELAGSLALLLAELDHLADLHLAVNDEDAVRSQEVLEALGGELVEVLVLRDGEVHMRGNLLHELDGLEQVVVVGMRRGRVLPEILAEVRREGGRGPRDELRAAGCNEGCAGRG